MLLKRNFRIWDFCIKFEPYLQTLWTFYSQTHRGKCFFSRSKSAGWTQNWRPSWRGQNSLVTSRVVYISELRVKSPSEYGVTRTSKSPKYSLSGSTVWMVALKMWVVLKTIKQRPYRCIFFSLRINIFLPEDAIREKRVRLIQRRRQNYFRMPCHCWDPLAENEWSAVSKWANIKWSRCISSWRTANAVPHCREEMI